jgi:phenylacetate-CoA ligase
MGVMDAILYRNYSWFGIGIGFRQARFWGHPLDRIGYLKIRLMDYLLNRIRYSPFRLGGAYYEIYLEQIQKFNAQYIYGYAQSVFQFSRYFYEKGADLSYLNLKAVILTGEMIFPHQIQIIRQVFSCKVTEEYGCTELGVIGFRCEHGTMHLMENLLTQNDNTSDHIIVSELYGRLFPFIRYETCDRGRIHNIPCPCGRKLVAFENISGRKDEFIRCPDGSLSDPYLLEYILNDMPRAYGKICQFRVIQKQMDRLEIYLVFESARGNLGTEKVREYILHAFFKHLSSQIKIGIYFVDALEREKSGKLRCFISEIEKSQPAKEECKASLFS